MYHVIKQSTVKTLSCGQTKKYWTKPSHKSMCPLTKSLHESTNDCVYLQHFYIIKKTPIKASAPEASLCPANLENLSQKLKLLIQMF